MRLQIRWEESGEIRIQRRGKRRSCAARSDENTVVGIRELHGVYQAGANRRRQSSNEWIGRLSPIPFQLWKGVIAPIARHRCRVDPCVLRVAERERVCLGQVVVSSDVLLAV